MPWLETAPVDKRIWFIQDALSDCFTMSELCARYGVSRRVGYKWLARYEARAARLARPQSCAAPLPPSPRRGDRGDHLWAPPPWRPRYVAARPEAGACRDKTGIKP